MDDVVHFRCRTGHAYSPEALLAKQTDTVEEALWAALRALEENAALARRLQRRLRHVSQAGPANAERYNRRAREAERHAEVLRRLLVQDEKKVGGG